MLLHRSTILIAAAAATTTALGTAATAAVIVNPRLVTGVNAIDPTGAEELDLNAVGAVAPATLTGRPDFSVVQRFIGTGFQRPQGGVGNSDFLTFTDPTTPDIRLTAAVGGTSTGANTNNVGLATSEDSSIFLGNGTLRYVIDFGDYDAGTEAFEANVNPVAAAGFTLVRQDSPTDSRQFSVDFLGDDGSILATQTHADDITNPEGSDVFYGFEAPAGSAIGSIVIRLTNGDGATLGGNLGLDDLGFTSVVPEPGSAALAFVGLGFLGLRRRARAAAMFNRAD